MSTAVPPGNEAQRLVAVSLGKIAASRSTRSGIRLHKSLMVSTVLFRARTAVIMEKYSGTRSSSSDEEDDEEVEQNTTTAATDAPPLQTTDIDDYDQSDTEFADDDDDDEFYDEPEDTEPAQVVPQVVDNTRNNNSVDSDCDKENGKQTPDDDTVANDNNNVCINTSRSVLSTCENTTQNLDNQVISKCERCTKRRLTEVEQAVDSISPCKRQRSSDDENISNSSSSDEENQLESSALEVPMEGIQITHLVDSFSSGFTGLLTADDTNTSATCDNTINHCSKNTTTSSTSCESVTNTTSNYSNNTTTSSDRDKCDPCVTHTLDTVIGVTDSLSNVMEKCGYKPASVSNTVSHTLTEAFNHCSSHIKEGFETLALPISLSV